MLSPPVDLRPQAVSGCGLASVATLLGVAVPGGAERVWLSGVTHDSHSVRPGDLYVALPGSATHGAHHVGAAASAGAVAVLTDPSGGQEASASGLPVLVVPDPRARLGAVAAQVYGQPATGLRLLGVTGTNGKTTTAHLVEAGLTAAGERAGLVGTVEIRVAGQAVPSRRTTPEATDLQGLLALMRERGVSTVAMEVSSHALVLGRVDGIVYDVAVFTNLGHDHLDFHGSIADYFAAKAELFTPQRARAGVVWLDESGWGQRLAAQARDSGLAVTTVAASPGADLLVGPPRPTGRAGQSGRLTGMLAGKPIDLEFSVDLPGSHNLADAALALVGLALLGVDPCRATAGVGACHVPGRMEPVWAGQDFLAVVDYAHTPDAVSCTLATLRERTDRRLLVVLGCGGDRDQGKRADMGRIAAELADLVVITDDNPRSEPAGGIREQLLAGARSVPAARRAQVQEVADRRAAIEWAVRSAGAGDVLAVLGKGHETGQEIAGVLHPFDDRTELRAAILGAPA